jgi:hypothetical protein
MSLTERCSKHVIVRGQAMNASGANTRYVGWTSAGLLIIATLTTWITISGPFIGSMSVTGIKTDDGKIALGLAVVLVAVAIVASRMWLGVCGVLAVDYYGYEFFHVTTFDIVDEGDSKFEQSIEKAFTINPGFGLYLGLLTGLALIGWGLAYPYSQKRKVVGSPSAEPESPAPE